LKTEILYAADNDTAFLDNMGQQAIFKGRVYKPSDLIAEVDKITASEVKSVRRFHFSNVTSYFLLSFFFSLLFFQYYETFNFYIQKKVIC